MSAADGEGAFRHGEARGRPDHPGLCQAAVRICAEQDGPHRRSRGTGIQNRAGGVPVAASQAGRARPWPLRVQNRALHMGAVRRREREGRQLRAAGRSRRRHGGSGRGVRGDPPAGDGRRAAAGNRVFVPAAARHRHQILLRRHDHRRDRRKRCTTCTGSMLRWPWSSISGAFSRWRQRGAKPASTCRAGT